MLRHSSQHRRGASSHTNKWILIAALLTTLLITETTQQGLNNVDITPRSEVKREGDTLRVLCRVASPINFCRFVINGEPKAILLNPTFETPGFKYIGEGFTAGQCGIEIPNIQAKHNGAVSCFMGVESQEFVGTMDLLVGNAPERPEMNLITQPQIKGSFEAYTELRASCISREGRPQANITWLLDEEVLTRGLPRPQVHEEGGLFTVVQELQHKLQPMDDGRELICRAEHVSYPTGFLETKYRLMVKFRPEKREEPFHVDGLALGHTAMVNVTFRANPQPQIEFYVDGTSIPQGGQRDRFEATVPVNVGPSEWMTTLIIADLSLEDTTKEYFLKASNQFGATEYRILINSTNNDTTAGLAIGWIVLIIILALIVVLSVVLVVVARRTGRWCFADRRSEIPLPKANETDTESVETGKVTKVDPAAPAPVAVAPKSKLKKPSLNFNAIFKKPNKNAKPEAAADQTGPADGQPAGDQTHPRDSEETVVITDELPEKKTKPAEDGIVYAELLLKPCEDSPSKGDNSTEYAEIVYTKSAANKPPVAAPTTDKS